MRKKSLAVVLSLMCCLCLAGTKSEAAELKTQGPMDGIMVDGSMLTSELESEGLWNKLSRGAYLASGASQIVNKGNNTIYMSGTTNCHKTVDRVKAIIYLQRLQNGSWVSVASEVYTAEDAYTISGGATAWVAGGYYYRVRGVHTAAKGEVLESGNSQTDGLYIG